MKIRSVLLFLVAIGAAALTATFARQWVSAEKAAILASQPKVEQVEVETVPVLVASADLPVGTFVKSEHLTWKEWPKSTLAPGYAVKVKIEEKITVDGKETTKVRAKSDGSEFLGSAVRAAVLEGEPITANRLVNAGERGFLAAVLESGMRAVSVPVDATTGISGFIFPGDWVDVILTVTTQVEDADGKARNRFLSKTLMEQVQVIAVDQQVGANAGNKAAKAPKTATLQVQPKQAERIALALRMGSLSLSLHSLAGEEYLDESLDLATAAGNELEGPYPEAVPSQEASYTLDEDVFAGIDELFAKPEPAPEPEVIEEEAPKVEVTVFRGSARDVTSF